MLQFNNWILSVVGLVARQYDNLSRRIDVEGNLPDGYIWQLLVQSGGNADTLLLQPTENGAGVVLTADNLSKSGEYYFQLRGVLEADGVTKRHTNVVSAHIPKSLTGVGTWPEVPTEFYQVEANILELYQHPPVPGSNGYWLVWDTDKDEYVESQLALPEVSVGPQGPKGDPGPAGVGVPDGGTDGQLLGKTADGTAWVDPPQSGLPSGGTPYQYLVTDGSGNTKWEDRLAWSEKKMELVSSTDSIANGTVIKGNFIITVGIRYEVILDGERYSLVGFNDKGYPTIGAPYDDYSVYPFNISLDGNMVYFNHAVSDGHNHSLSIYEEQEVIHPVDQKFLKAQYTEYEITEQFDSHANATYSCELSFNDAYSMGEEKLSKSIKYANNFPTVVRISNSRNIGRYIILKFDSYTANSDNTVTVKEFLFIWRNSGVLNNATRKGS